MLFVDHGDVATGAGFAASIDLFLHVIEAARGASAAQAASRRIVARSRGADQPQLIPQ